MIYVPLHANPCPALCSRHENPRIWEVFLHQFLDYNHVYQACTLLEGRGGSAANYLRQAGIVSDRKLSKEWSCSVSVTSPSSAQPSPAAHTPPLFIKYLFGPVYGRGGCRSSNLLSAPVYTYLKCQGIMQLPSRHDCSPTQSYGLMTTQQQTSFQTTQRLHSSSPDSMVQFPHDTPRWPAVCTLKGDNTVCNYYVWAEGGLRANAILVLKEEKKK